MAAPKVSARYKAHPIFITNTTDTVCLVRVSSEKKVITTQNVQAAASKSGSSKLAMSGKIESNLYGSIEAATSSESAQSQSNKNAYEIKMAFSGFIKEGFVQIMPRDTKKFTVEGIPYLTLRVPGCGTSMVDNYHADATNFVIWESGNWFDLKTAKAQSAKTDDDWKEPVWPKQNLKHKYALTLGNIRVVNDLKRKIKNVRVCFVNGNKSTGDVVSYVFDWKTIDIHLQQNTVDGTYSERTFGALKPDQHRAVKGFRARTDLRGYWDVEFEIKKKGQWTTYKFSKNNAQCNVWPMDSGKKVTITILKEGDKYRCNMLLASGNAYFYFKRGSW